MLKHVGDGGVCSIRFNGFSLADIEFIRWNSNPPSLFVLKGRQRIGSESTDGARWQTSEVLADWQARRDDQRDRSAGVARGRVKTSEVLEKVIHGSR